METRSREKVPKKVTRSHIGLADDPDAPFEANVAVEDRAADLASSDTDVEAIDDAASSVDQPLSSHDQQYIGRWNQLISYSNWEKGKIILQWRETSSEEGADPSAYSDEAWARKVEGVTAQHVGRLRRVYARFGQDHRTYPGLYWTHFLAALDWDDAAMWLEGAAREKWSVSQLRRARWQATGGAAAEEPVELLTTVEPDEDYDPIASADDEPKAGVASRENFDSEALPEGPDFGDDDNDRERASGSKDEPEIEQAIGKMTAENPFASLGTLPDDVADAMEQMKLAIVRHRCRDWEEITVEQMMAVLDALRSFAIGGIK